MPNSLKELRLKTKTPAKDTFSVAISTESYQNLIRNTLKDPKRANRFIASITSAVATTPALQTCEPSSILAGGLLNYTRENQ